jgi:hypothetical protein
LVKIGRRRGATAVKKGEGGDFALAATRFGFP